MKKRLVVFAVMLLAAFSFYSCSNASKLKKANETYYSGGYYSAARLYRGIGEKGISQSERLLINFRVGECYRILNSPEQAELAYNRVVRNRNNTIDEVYLRLGEVLLMNKKHDKAIENFNLYKERVPDDPRADRGIASAMLAKEQANKNTDIIVENFGAINTTYNDFAPAYGTADYEMLLFTSSRNDGKNTKKKQPGTGQRPSSLFYTQQGTKGWDKPKMLGDEVNGKRDEDGAAMFNSSYDILYFTKSIKSSGDIEGCTIYTAVRTPSYDWEPAEPLLETNDSLMMAHPSISDDGLTLYFVSNMSGGFGGLDIWKLTRKTLNGDWGEPMNLGSEINTPDNEMYPFIRANGELYFSSNGRVGYGGLDIFKATPTEGGGWLLENMGPPFNSELDDFAMVLERINNNGYFSSRRKGGKGGDDVYHFYKNIPVIEYFVEGLTLDQDTRKPIGGAEVKLMGNNGSVLIRKTEADGKYKFKLNPNTDYISIASAAGFLNQKSQLTTRELTDSHTFRDTMRMVSTNKPIEIPNIFFEYGKADLSDESRESLDQLVELMNDNPDIVVELAAHTDSRGSGEANIELSQRRAQAVVDYLIRDGISEDRMVAKGYGEDVPKVVDKATAAKYKFLGEGRELTELYINTLSSEEYKEIAHQLNRRTELIVLNARNRRR